MPFIRNCVIKQSLGGRRSSKYYLKLLILKLLLQSVCMSDGIPLRATKLFNDFRKAFVDKSDTTSKCTDFTATDTIMAK